MARYPFDDTTRKALARAVEEARRRSHSYVDPTHIALGLLAIEDPDLVRILALLEVPHDRLRRTLAGSLGPLAPLSPASASVGNAHELPWTAIAKRALGEALAAARSLGHRRVRPVHVLLGIVETTHPAATTLREFGATPGRVREEYRRFPPRDGDRPTDLESADGPPRRRRSSHRKQSARNWESTRRLEDRGSASRSVWFAEVDPDSQEPLYEQLIRAVEEAVATGKLVENERLPSVRDLAAELGIAPGTVARSYSRLEEKGILVTEGARGTRVAERPAEARPDDLVDTLEGLLRPVAVAAYHMGARAQEVRNALETAMRGIYGAPGEPPVT